MMPIRAATAALLVVASFGQQNDTDLVWQHVKSNASTTFREAQGYLKFPFLVPSGPYNQLWDWDGLFLGMATLEFGSLPYLTGSMLNFLDHTNLTNGDVKGCLTIDGSTDTLYHAKPIIIQGAWLASRAGGNTSVFEPYYPQMAALLQYWSSPNRLDPATGLYYWHDQLETGADNLVLSECPSDLSPECWVESSDAYTLSSPDIMTFMFREHSAYSLFLESWAAGKEAGSPLASTYLTLAARHRAAAADIKASVNAYMWHWADDTHSSGWYAAYNRSTGTQILARTYQMAFPLWANLTLNATQETAALNAIFSPDVWTTFGLRSTSNMDLRYNNSNIITPYSQWRGPIWINVNCITAWTLATRGYSSIAKQLADNIVHVLAEDLVDAGAWHECYSSDTGAGLAAPGFLSWNTLGARVQADVAGKMDPMAF